jgi:hypothetical protein
MSALPIADWRLPIAQDIAMDAFQSAIGNRQSPIP